MANIFAAPWWITGLAVFGVLAIGTAIITLFFKLGRRPDRLWSLAAPPLDSADFLRGIAGIVNAPINTSTTEPSKHTEILRKRNFTAEYAADAEGSLGAGAAAAASESAETLSCQHTASAGSRQARAAQRTRTAVCSTKTRPMKMTDPPVARRSPSVHNPRPPRSPR